MRVIYFSILCLISTLEAKPEHKHEAIIIQDSNDLKHAVRESSSGSQVAYDKTFLRKFAVKLREYLSKISDNVVSIEEELLTPLNKTIDAWKSPSKTTTESSHDTDEEEHAEVTKPSKGNKNHAHHDAHDETDAKDKECEYYNRHHSHDDMLEMDLAEECARRERNKGKHPPQKTAKAAPSDDETERGKDVDRDKRGESRSGLSVFSEMFLKNEPKHSEHTV